MKTLVSLFLMAHGLMHASYFTPKPNDPNYPFDFSNGWFANLVGDTAKPIGATIIVAVLVAFIAAGLGLMGVTGLQNHWQLFMTVGAINSTILLVLFWHRWLVLGIVINLVLLYGVHVLNWMLE